MSYLCICGSCCRDFYDENKRAVTCPLCRRPAVNAPTQAREASPSSAAAAASAPEGKDAASIAEAVRARLSTMLPSIWKSGWTQSDTDEVRDAIAACMSEPTQAAADAHLVRASPSLAPEGKNTIDLPIDRDTSCGLRPLVPPEGYDPSKMPPALTPEGRAWSGRFYSRFIGMGYENNAAVVMANHAADVVLYHLAPTQAVTAAHPPSASPQSAPEGQGVDYREAWIAARAVVRAARVVCAAFTEDDAPHIDEAQDIGLQELRDEVTAYDQRNHDRDAAPPPPPEGAAGLIAERDRMLGALIEVRTLVDRIWHGRVGGSFAYDVIDRGIGEDYDDTAQATDSAPAPTEGERPEGSRG